MQTIERYLVALRREFPHPSPAMALYLRCVRRAADITESDASDDVYFEAFVRSQAAFDQLSIGERTICKRIGDRFIHS